MKKVEIDVKVDCGNAPNKEMLKQMMVEGVKGNVDFVIDRLDSEVTVDQIGRGQLEGKGQVKQVLEKIDYSIFQRLTIQNIVTHGRDAALNGVVTTKDGERYNFAFFIILKLGKEKSITNITAYIL